MSTFSDFIYPKVDPLPQGQITQIANREQAQLTAVSSSITPSRYSDAYGKLLEDESERLKSVESRLTSLLGLTSITASLLVGGTMALVNGALSDSSRWVRALAALGVLYLSLQIICSTLAALRGLGRARWVRSGIDDLIADQHSGPLAAARARALQICEQYQVTDQNVNFKVTQMAVAHTAIRNFAFGSVMIAVMGFVAVLFQAPGSAAAKAIRRDADLQRLLRGPSGPPGQTGPPGPPGPPRPSEPAGRGAPTKLSGNR